MLINEWLDKTYSVWIISLWVSSKSILSLYINLYTEFQNVQAFSLLIKLSNDRYFVVIR